MLLGALSASAAVPHGIANVMGARSWEQIAEPPYGMYSFPMEDGTPVRIAGNVVPGNLGAVYVGDRYFVIEGIATSISSFITNYLYDTDTWQKITDFRGENITAFDMAWNEQTDIVYGYFHSFEDEHEYFGTIDINTGKTEEICQLPFIVRAMSFDSNGQLYAISSQGALYRIDTETGAYELVGETGCQSRWTTSGAIDGSTRSFYYITCNDNNSDIYKIDLDSAEATYMGELDDNMEIAGLYFPDPSALPSAPAKGEITASFIDGSLDGTLSIVLPQTTFDGSALNGELSYTVYQGNEIISSGKGNPGASFEIEVSEVEAGEYSFFLKVNNEVGDGPVAKIKVWIGPDVPAKPSYVNLKYEGEGKFIISWPEVTAQHGGWLDLSAVSYTVMRYGATDKKFENIDGSPFTDVVNMPYEDEYATYHYEVAVVYEGVTGSFASSEYYTIGSRTPPFEEGFNARWDLGKFTIFEGENSDNERWYFNSEDKAVSLTTYTAKGGDDYLVLPPVELMAGLEYPVSFDIKAKYSTDVERVEVLAGKLPTVEGLNEVIMEPTDVSSLEYINLKADFVPAESATYFIAIHAISIPFQGQITIDNIKIDAGVVGVKVQKISGSVIKAYKGMVEISTEEPVDFEIYTVSGAMVKKGEVSGTQTIELPSGIYLLRVGTQTSKLLL